ncbi:hypothetical protein V8C35DRAFT_321587 [Trichoderma chlorosporum]
MSGTRRDAPPHHKHKDGVPDAGLRSLDHYKRALPKWRYDLRQQALPLIRWETPYLAAIQSKLRTPALDSYFAITANLGTHTFFMVFLPMLFWGGYPAFAKGLVHILALGVFWTGFVKDFYSLPRPLSPPLHRITMSGSAALEYGFPSTHSANAVSVAVYALLHLRDPLNTFSDTTKLLLEILSYFYAASIVFGRLYCGMHGFLDVIIGSVMGAGITILEYYYGPPLDAAMQNGSWLAPLIAGLVVVVFVRIHPEPADDCPCFDDSVAFAGVVIGVEAATWTIAGSFLAGAESSMGVLPYASWVIAARMVVGIIVIFAWRETMKPTLLKVLPHVFRLIESTGFDLPRRFFTPASEYKSVPPGSRLDTLFPTASDFPRMVESIRHPTTRGRSVSIGPQSAADAYETLAYRERQRRDSIGSNASLKSKSSNLDLNGKDEDKSGKGAQTSGAQKAVLNDNESLRGPNDVLIMQGAENGNPDIYLSMEDARDEKEVFSQLVKPRVRYDVEVVTKLVVYGGRLLENLVLILATAIPAKMSDYEDEMDVDGPGPSADITFSAEATKGKRSAANLPVEAEDTLPWVEKYRPVTLDDVSGHQDILATINKFVESNRLPHLLLYGPPGTGKTSTILALARRIYGTANMRQMVLELNASDDRGIDVVREQIKTFASTKQIFSMASSAAKSNSIAGFKLIILDEADAMTNTAQMALRRIMEKYTANTRFCIIANYAHKLSPALLSRCTRFRFSPLKEGDIRVLVEKVVEEENVKIQGEAVDALVKLSKGDMRRALNVLQACHASSTPLRLKNEPKPPESEIKRETITTETIYNCIAAPQPDAIKEIMETLLSTPDVTSCLNTINALKTTQGLALADIITALSEQLTKLEVSAEVMITWLEGLADIEHRVAGGASEMVQTGAVVGVVRGGVELMSK